MSIPSIKTILVTGGAGSLGLELVLNLARAGHRVRALDLPHCDFSAIEAQDRASAWPGSITDAVMMQKAVDGVDLVIHLAALLPPASELNRERTMAINVDGTGALLAALAGCAPDAHLVLASSVCVYGMPRQDAEIIDIARPTAPVDIYGESKVRAEELVRRSGLAHTILRISGIAVAAFLAPPEVWPFEADQPIEFVSRRDVQRALLGCVDAGPANATYHVAGGQSWRMTGRTYASAMNEALGLDAEDAAYLSQPGTFCWYDTAASQTWLGYQQTSFEQFRAFLEQAVADALAD